MKNSHNDAKEINKALLNAAHNGHVEVVIKLLEAGADINVVNSSGGTALILAAHNGHLEVVRELLTAGANPNATDKYGNTVLMWAAEDGHVKVVRELLAAGANPNAVDGNAMTALMLAAESGNNNMVELLLLSGAQLPNRRIPNIINNAIRGICHSFRILQAFDLQGVLRGFIPHKGAVYTIMTYKVHEELAKSFYTNKPTPGLAGLLEFAEDSEQENRFNNS